MDRKENIVYPINKGKFTTRYMLLETFCDRVYNGDYELSLGGIKDVKASRNTSTINEFN